MTTSKTFDLAGIVKAISEATEFINGALSNWRVASSSDPATRTQQEELLKRLEAISFDLTKIPELQAWASLDADEINEILRREGFEIQVTPWPNDGRTFGVLAILDLTVEWLEAGDGDESITVYPKDESGRPNYRAQPDVYKAFELYTRENRIEYRDVPGSDEPLIRIPTKNGDTVCIHVMPRTEIADFDLYNEVTRISTEAVSNNDKYRTVKDVTIPKVSLRQQVDISWMEGMETTGVNPFTNEEVDFRVDEAKQEVRFGMNERGARAKTATVVVMRSLSMSEDLEHIQVDDDFLLWIERPGVSTPVFVGYFAKDDSWSDPGALENV